VEVTGEVVYGGRMGREGAASTTGTYELLLLPIEYIGINLA
jgi:hypothetical protein